MNNERLPHLLGRVTLTGEIEALSGLHIGGSDQGIGRRNAGQHVAIGDEVERAERAGRRHSIRPSSGDDALA